MSQNNARKKLTPTHRKLLAVLRDQKQHSGIELKEKCLRPGSSSALLRVHICTLRARIQPLGKTIVCEITKNQAQYRLIEFPTN